MSYLVTRNPTSNTSPDPGQGGAAVTGNINTGHGVTTSTSSRSTTGTTSQTKTCLWSSFSGISGPILAINLKFDWVAIGSASADTNDIGDSAQGTITFKVDYSLNNGGSWTTKVNQSKVASASAGSSDSQSLNTSGSETQSISITTPIGQIQVRDSIFTEAIVNRVVAASASGGFTDVHISGIRLEIMTQNQQVIIMM